MTISAYIRRYKILDDYEINEVKKIILEAEYAVFFGGAGVSTESGIPDFRSAKGIYSGEGAEYFLSIRCLEKEPERFYEFFRSNLMHPYAEPNDAHVALVTLEERGMIQAIITQNIDGLHQMAGSTEVIELHGNASRFFCPICGKRYTTEYVLGEAGAPRCKSCNGIIRPDITLYGEPLDSGEFYRAEEEIFNADVLIVGGTSLTVNPAASLVGEFRGEHLIIINYTPTPYDGMAEYVIRASVSEVLGGIADDL